MIWQEMGIQIQSSFLWLHWRHISVDIRETIDKHLVTLHICIMLSMLHKCYINISTSLLIPDLGDFLHYLFALKCILEISNTSIALVLKK